MKYYIADTHFGHQNILSFAKRPFSTIDEMEKTIISNWNHTVNENDEVYIVGDLFYRDNIPGRILSQLKGRKNTNFRESRSTLANERAENLF